MSVWDDARLGGRAGGKHALGLWDPRHHMAALAWMPPVSQRRQIFGKQRYQYALNVMLSGTAVGSDRFTVTSDFWWTDTIATYRGANLATRTYPSFSVQLYESKSGRPYMNTPQFVENLAGTFDAVFGTNTFDGNAVAPLSSTVHFPYFHRRITRIPAGAVMVGRFQNVITAATLEDNNAPLQLVLGGYTE